MSSMTGQTGYSGQTATGGKQFKEKKPSGYSTATLQQFTPEQLQLFQQMFQHLGPESYLGRLAGGDEEIFKQIEQPALKQFGGLQAGIASRFSGMGGLGARKSSGFQNTQNQAAADFASQLQSQRQSLQQNAIRDLMGLSNQLLNQRPYERSYVEKPKSFAHEAGVAAAGGFGQAAGAGLTKWATGGI
jgi:hypothetical protein